MTIRRRRTSNTDKTSTSHNRQSQDPVEKWANQKYIILFLVSLGGLVGPLTGKQRNDSSPLSVKSFI